MVVDTSALLAILLREGGWASIAKAVLADSERLMSSISRLEATMVIEGRRPGHASDLEALLEHLRIEVVPFDQIQLEHAIDAFRRYGKGRHPAGLNLGDCCSYGLAKSLNEPLLFKGNDFSLTDVEPALKG